MTRPAAEVERVLLLDRMGYNKCQIARETGIPRGTLSMWIDPRYQRGPPKPGCFRCDDRSPALAQQYAYLLGLYLGDGCLSAYPRGVWRLRIVQDARYVDLIESCCQVMGAISQNRIGRVRCPGCVEIHGSWKHWIHLFPQHAPGRKHERSIELEPWQKEIVATFPKEFLAGLVHADGCRTINTIRSTDTRGASRQYSYPRYQFTNASDDIRLLFTETCELLGVRWTRTNTRVVSVSRRPDVAFLDTFIGPKS